MSVTALWSLGADSDELVLLAPPVLERTRIVAALANDATLDPPTGDPMELALLRFVGTEHVRAERAARPRLRSFPVDSERKRMSSVHAAGQGITVIAKGAPESRYWTRARMLCTWTGSAGVCVTANGVRSSRRRIGWASEGMATGDHPATALAIGRDVGLDTDAPPVIGAQIEAGGPPADPSATSIYARVEPSHKLDLVRSLQQLGEVVAMTGDGVNDAPALRVADIGVALGQRSSDVARGAADMVVTDDDLATIVTATREGRGIYDNIRKVVDYLVAGNLSEIGVVIGALLLMPWIGVPLLRCSCCGSTCSRTDCRHWRSATTVPIRG